MNLELGRDSEAADDLRNVPELLKQSKKINGRPLPFDRFVKRKMQHYFDSSTGKERGRRKHGMVVFMCAFAVIYTLN